MTAETDRSVRFYCEVKNKKGLHARACAKLESLLEQYSCRARFCHGANSADDSSVLQLLKLDAPQGSVIEIWLRGPQARQARDAVEDLFERRFDEDQGL